MKGYKMKKISIALIIAILSIGSVSAMADGDAWSNMQKKVKKQKAESKKQKKDLKQEVKEEKKKNKDQ